jgi:hypothetical protein
MVLRSVPNQIWRERSSKTMWRTVPPPLSIAAEAKKRCVLGSRRRS